MGAKGVSCQVGTNILYIAYILYLVLELLIYAYKIY